MVDFNHIELVERDNCYIICNHSIYYKVGKKEGSVIADLKNGFRLEEISEQLSVSLSDLELLLKTFEDNGVIGAPKNEKQSIFFYRIPLFSPDAFLEKLATKIKSYKYVAFFTLLLSNLIILLGFASFLQDRSDIFTLNVLKLKISEYVLLYIVFFLTVVLHEFAHGLTCKYFGCKVGKIGFVLIFLAPAMYCDISGVRMLPDKSRQIITSFAGIYVNIIVLSIASLLFHGAFRTPAMAVFILLNMTTIIANLIPFIRLDGYWILSFALGITNLYKKSLKGIRNLFHHCTSEEKFIAFYGIVNWCFIGVALYSGVLSIAGLLSRLLDI